EDNENHQIYDSLGSMTFSASPICRLGGALAKPNKTGSGVGLHFVSPNLQVAGLARQNPGILRRCEFREG
ncbi:MAG: hypothetical protein O3C67_13015, partial [Cyanobacteria bacterium]|nr:hypothetical protein [Cyanobacteriota bacterium]MDA0867805.1 hypothetical protein [Cyanobacteriota bacterium]